jgi:hypothetical protein
MEEIQQGLKEPCFFISSVNPTFRHYMGKRYLRQSQFVIQYFPESKDNANAECDEVAERMCWCLEVIDASGGLVRGRKMKYEIVDGVLNFFVNYDCFVYQMGQQERMEGMKSSTNVKG